MGYYSNWERQSIHIIPSLKWYSVNTMMEFLDGLRYHIIHKKPSYSSKAAPQQPPTNIPATKNSRFPNDISYLCEGIGDWNVHFDLLLYSLNIMNNAKRLEESNFRNLGQVEMFAIEKINLLFQSIASNLVTRDRFEHIYELVWINMYFIFLVEDNKVVSFVLTEILQRVDRIWNTH